MLPCLYCESAAGDLPQAVVHQDRDVVALLDWRQAAPGHVLVLPRLHLSAEELFSTPAGVAVMATTMRVARAVREALGAEGVQMGAILYPGSAGPARSSGRVRLLEESSMQTAEDGHFHLHLLPRQHGDEVARIYPFGDEISRPEALEGIAARIRAALRGGTGESGGLGRAVGRNGA